MPNIEIHGTRKKKAKKLRERIFKLFRNEKYIDELVVTIYSTDVKGVDMVRQPFIRLVNSRQKSTEDIIVKLRGLNIDIEHLVLEAFIESAPLADQN